ncbi:insulinase family protein [Shewanella sp. Scap07]|nr:pitrilysin family protein [Shewanella sp. Scap07]QLE86785.1 insulinase family protein [Shewanella sp. Scap07]
MPIKCLWPTLRQSIVLILLLIGTTTPGWFSAALAAETSLMTMAKPLYEVEQQIEYLQLENGLQLRLLPQNSASSVTIASEFAVGSRDENPGQTGYAHLFEHMLFKGSENAPGDSYAQTMSQFSGRFNASTFFEFTNYYATVPSYALKLALWLEADRFMAPQLSDATVTNQQHTVLEEMATTIDNQPYVRQAMEFLLAQAKGSPYGHAVIGSAEDIQAATPQSLLEFHQRYYRPDNMQLSLVGSLPAQTLDWVNGAFAHWQQPEKPLPKRDTHYTFEAKSVSGEIIDSRGPWPALLLAWHTVGQQHQDAAAITLLENYLLQNRSSLVRQRGLSQNEFLLSYSIPLSMQYMGVSNLVLVPRAAVSLDLLADNVDRLIADVAANGVDAAALRQLKQNWLINALQKLDDPATLAKQLSATAALDKLTPLTGPWERIYAVTPEQLQAAAQQYFQQGTVTLKLLPPWYIRWGKTLMEWLPSSLAESIEEWAL